MGTLAGVVLFNPDIARLKENYTAIKGQVDKVVFFNNGSKNIADIKRMFPETEDLQYLDSNDNMGIAFALKAIMNYAIQFEYQWVLTLDQDSVCSTSLVEIYLKYANIERVGILTCNIVDRNFSEKEEKNVATYTEIKQCITSASLINVEAYKHTDGFDEKMFIDSVDFDLCINMRLNGYKIIKVNFDGILHEVGHGKNVRFLNKNYIVYNHSPFRNYYIARNRFYLLKKYPRELSLIKEVLHECRLEVMILLFEEDRIKKLKQRWRGIKDSKKL